MPGYERRYYEITDVLKKLCLSFYLILTDRWNEETSHSELDIDNDTGNVIAIDSDNF